MGYTATATKTAAPFNAQTPATTGAIVPVSRGGTITTPSSRTGSSGIAPRVKVPSPPTNVTIDVKATVISKEVVRPQRVQTLTSTSPQTSRSATINYEQEKAIADVIGNFGLGAYDELTRRKQRNEISNISTPAGVLAYEAGRRAADGGREAGRKIADELSKVKPPRIEFPKLDVPGLPDIKFPEFSIPQIKIPELPRFKFPEIPQPQAPEIKYPEPQPQEKTPPWAEIPPTQKPIPDDPNTREINTPCRCGTGIRWVTHVKVSMRDGDTSSFASQAPPSLPSWDTPVSQVTATGVRFGGNSDITWENGDIPDNLSPSLFVRRYTVLRDTGGGRTEETGVYYLEIIADSYHGDIYSGRQYLNIPLPNSYRASTLVGWKNVPLKWGVLSYSCANNNECDERRPPRREPPPPPVPRKGKDKPMCCEDLKRLIALLIKRVGDLPANVPDDLTKDSPSMQKKESLAELQLWQVQQLDALLGQYPVKITIEDEDLTQEGNQKREYILPNVAETLAEQMGLILQIKRETDAILATALAAMMEAGQAKQIATITHDIALANADYLGYELKQKQREIEFVYTANKSTIDATLQPSKEFVPTYEKAGEDNLQLDLKNLRLFYAMWKAQNFRQVGSKADLMAHLTKGMAAIKDNELKAIQKNIDEQADENSKRTTSFGDFLEQVERGFIDTIGATDNMNPWGDDIKDRPKLREIGYKPKNSQGNEI